MRTFFTRYKRAAQPQANAPALADAAAASGLILLVLSLSPVSPVRASTASAEEAYKKGDYVTAAREYAAAAQRDPKKLA